jgi:hypothetical protein
MEAVHSSETSLNFYYSNRYYKPEDSAHHSDSHDNVKSQKMSIDLLIFEESYLPSRYTIRVWYV